VVERCGVSMVLTLGALLADVAHTRPVQVVGTAADQAIIDRYDLRRSSYEGPTGIVGVLHDACVTADVPSASLWAAVPAYASQVPSPKASLALVERACQILGTPAPLLGLTDLADGYENRVTRLVQDDSDLIGYISRLEDMSDGNELFFDEVDDEADDGYDDDLEVDHDELAEALTDRLSSEDLMAEVEQFLRDQGESGPGPR
jgi:hypothetical protein